MRRDVLAVVESVYRPAATRREWLERLVRAMAPLLGEGSGMAGWFFDASDGTVRADFADGFITGISAEAQSARAAFHENRVALPRDKPDLSSFYAAAPPVTTASGVFGEVWTEACRSCGLDAKKLDFVQVLVADPTQRGSCFAFMRGSPTSVDPTTQRVWRRVVAHVAAGQRLLPVLTAGQPARTAETADAIVDNAGRVIHARGVARASEARTSLRDAALRTDRARTRRERADPERALELWRGLVDGRWSFVDRFDTDGRRFLVAYRNDPRVTSPRALTLRERQVAAYAAMGHANKLIAYELGLSVGAVSAYLTTALKKLGLRSRADLVALVAQRAVSAAPK